LNVDGEDKVSEYSSQSFPCLLSEPKQHNWYATLYYREGT